MKPVVGFPGYFATDEGEIFSNRTGSLNKITPRLSRGYLLVNVKAGSGRKTVKKKYVHQLVLFAYHGPKPFDEAVCRHMNGNRMDNKPGNLCWGTVQENNLDAVRHGTAITLRRGDEHPRTIMSDADVRAVRCSKVDAAVLAIQHGVTPEWIGRIRAGKARSAVSP